jgi:hypothetical protein
MWFYEIRGTGNRLVKRDGQFRTEEDAIATGYAYLADNKAAILRRDDLDEVLSVIAGRTADFIRPDPASQP